MLWIPSLSTGLTWKNAWANNEYAGSDGAPIYHFDFYRLESPEEALDIGAEDYFYSGHLCLIEWPDRIGTLLPEDASEVGITVNPDHSRTISF